MGGHHLDQFQGVHGRRAGQTARRAHGATPGRLIAHWPRGRGEVPEAHVGRERELAQTGSGLLNVCVRHLHLVAGPGSGGHGRPQAGGSSGDVRPAARHRRPGPGELLDRTDLG